MLLKRELVGYKIAISHGVLHCNDKSR